MGLKHSLPLLAVLALGACTQPRTQVLLVVDTDLAVPDALDEIAIEVESPLLERQFANALLRNEPAPRSLNLVHEGGPLGPFDVRVRGLRASAPVVEQNVEFMFVPDETRVLRVMLLSSCVGTACGGEQTCDQDGCRPRLRAEEELEEFDGDVPLGDAGAGPDDAGPDDAGPEDAGARDAGPVDAGPCSPSDEVCNGDDDDCDGSVDEGFDLDSDRTNCGRCGAVCEGECVDGACVARCEAGTANCDGDPSDCETDTTSDAENCGGCGTVCEGRRDMCCQGSCQRRCR